MTIVVTNISLPKVGPDETWFIRTSISLPCQKDLEKRNKIRNPHHDKSKAFPSQIAQVQTSWLHFYNKEVLLITDTFIG